MLTLLIGHRGVGKTSLLKRIQTYREKAGFPKGHFLDLDKEISRKKKLSIENLFSQFGEAPFRQMEEEVLFELIENQKDPTYIALGAGYEGRIPAQALRVWIRRETDDLGRIFLDRPRLNPNLSSLEEFFHRKKEREERYKRQSEGLQLMLREGVESDFGEAVFFLQAEAHFYKERKTLWPFPSNPSFKKEGILTLQPEWKKKEDLLSRVWVKRFELRDDWLSEKQREEWREKLKEEKILLSFRSQKRKKSKILKKTKEEREKRVLREERSLKDWALELGPPPRKENIHIVSLHEGKNLTEDLKVLEKKGKNKMLKSAPLIQGFSDLQLGFKWQQEDPKKRSFLPRSSSGRWKWFRLFMKNKMTLNFFRLSLEKENLQDQPTFCEWMNTVEEQKGFAAVLGKPIQHSRSVTRHEAFFRDSNLFSTPLPFYAIEVDLKEFEEAFKVLLELGLKAAAITSPLKQKAFEIAEERSQEAEELGSLNTLFVQEEKGKKRLLGHNTDFEGLNQSLLNQEIPEPIAIWGGGGTLPILKKVFKKKETLFFSARSGKRRSQEKRKEKKEEKPRSLVWASGPFYSFPKNFHWPLELVMDLSYTDHSPARELALEKKCTYLSGLNMFEYQAEKQNHFWTSCFKREHSKGERKK